jgi:tight adherence protein B
MNVFEFLGGQDAGPEALIIVLLPLGCILLLYGLFSENERTPLYRRMDAVRARNATRAPGEAYVSIARQKNKRSEIAFLDTLIRRALPRQDVLNLRIERAGMSFSIGVYVLTSLLIAVASGVLAGSVAGAPTAIAILTGFTMGLYLPHSFLGWMLKRRQTRFIEHFPDAIDLMVRGLKAGLPIGESIKTAGQEIPDPVGIELRRVTDGIRIGRKMDDILWEASRRVNLQEFDFFTIALSIQAETGGNLAETLNNLTDVLRGRRQLKRKIRALSSEAKASAYIIGSLPFIMTLLIYLVNSEYITGLFADPRGQAMIGFGLFMILVGTAVMFKMVKFEI